ncbi:hypothetical protein K435DRAFT_967190 [Dendrothele bispora CBS 962.96]|uniref:Uncharacterized protein n=1 Tax=Dendrothele bispora (strain CBS 962.96) TaxID=1314807 RepID=A0A4S8LVG2_DENBC|nr:hypothetical protein K435DRAFT_967190 [Dendrothele bispora CBS 962.96]
MAVPDWGQPSPSSFALLGILESCTGLEHLELGRSRYSLIVVSGQNSLETLQLKSMRISTSIDLLEQAPLMSLVNTTKLRQLECSAVSSWEEDRFLKSLTKTSLEHLTWHVHGRRVPHHPGDMEFFTSLPKLAFLHVHLSVKNDLLPTSRKYPEAVTTFALNYAMDVIDALSKSSTIRELMLHFNWESFITVTPEGIFHPQWSMWETLDRKSSVSDQEGGLTTKIVLDFARVDRLSGHSLRTEACEAFSGAHSRDRLTILFDGQPQPLN